MSSLSAKIAIATGMGQQECDLFVKSLFETVASRLKDGDEVKIKDLGVFKLTNVDSRKSVNVANGKSFEIPAHRKVVFIASKEYASAINQAFEAFETVEFLTDGDEDEFAIDEINDLERSLYYNVEEENKPVEEVGEPQENPDESHPIPDYELEEETDAISSNLTTNPAEPEIENNFIDEKVSEENTVTPQRFEEQSQEEYADDEDTAEAYLYQLEEENKSSAQIINNNGSRFGRGFIFGALSGILVFICLFVIGYYCGWLKGLHQNSEYLAEVAPSENQIEEDGIENTTAEDTSGVNEVEEIVPVVYDTVSTTRYLTTIARDHYGNFNMWPYLYIENQSILGHPDRIKPGTRIVVPSLEKYGVDAKNRDDIEEAKKKGREIYEKFR